MCIRDRKKALSNAKSRLAGDINTTMKVVSDQYVKSSEYNNKEEVLERFEENGSELEQPLAIARDISLLYSNLTSNQSLAEYLLAHPAHRHIVRRIQLSEKFPYSEIRDNLLNSKMLPIDMLRCKLSFFGATKFDPRSDRWVRICMFKDAPFPNELTDEDNWSYGVQAC